MAFPPFPGGGPPPGPVAAGYARARLAEIAAAHRLPSAEVLEGVDDERRVRRLRYRLQFWRLLRRVR